jgi:NAD(P)-dependent dehydrogenase (short-subunit alcohol dehydrogenase family)
MLLDTMPARTGTCVVVGSSSGIGLAIARRLALEGRRVAMLARRSDVLEVQAGLVNAYRRRQ